MKYEAPSSSTPSKDRTPFQRTLERLTLCAYAIQEVHYELEAIDDPERKADLLITTENLAYEAVDLLNTVKTYVWGPESEDQEESSEDL